MTNNLIITLLDSPSPGAVLVTDLTNTKTHRVLLAVADYPYDPTCSDRPWPDFADYTPMGECPTHGLEPHRAESMECKTGGDDIYLAPVFACGQGDFTHLF